tara:strand:+ start:311 stop:700 length:390 start_codon:yes stop_codon:yes gene_type:complete
MAFKMKRTSLYKMEKRKNSAYPSKEGKEEIKDSEKFRNTVDETKKLSTTDEKAKNLSKTYGVNFTYREDKDGRMRYLTEDGFNAKQVAINQSREKKGLDPLSPEMLRTTVSKDETDKRILNAPRDMDVL